MKNTIGSLLIYFFFLSTSPSYAFKINTHVYVGNEVLQSLRKCSDRIFKIGYCIELELTDGKIIKIDVPRNIAKAILDNPRSYLFGTYGPDAFPDMLAGQTVIHPGIADGDINSYGTGDWLKHLLTSLSNDQNTERNELNKNVAFTYGYAGHLAADVFAHTYVNQYSGGEFSLTDGETEIDERHILLESLISKYTPEVEGNTYNHMKKGIDKDIPYKFIANHFYHSDVARKEFDKQPTSAHIVLYGNIYREFDRALKRVKLEREEFNLEKVSKNLGYNNLFTFQEFINEYNDELEGAGLVQLIEIYVPKFITAYYTGLNIDAKDAEELTKLKNKLDSFSNEKTVDALNELIEIEKELTL